MERPMLLKPSNFKCPIITRTAIPIGDIGNSNPAWFFDIWKSSWVVYFWGQNLECQYFLFNKIEFLQE